MSEFCWLSEDRTYYNIWYADYCFRRHFSVVNATQILPHQGCHPIARNNIARRYYKRADMLQLEI